MYSFFKKALLLGYVISMCTLLGGCASTMLPDGPTNLEDEVLCQLPDNRANSQVNVNDEWSRVGTVAKYTCDPGFYLITGQDHRTCQIDGKWSGEAPSCLKMVSFGKNASCMGDTCVDPRQPTTNTLLLLDNKDDSCFFMSPIDKRQAALQYRIDLLEEFRGISAFRFLFRTQSKDFSIFRITLEPSNNVAVELSPSNCIIMQKDLSRNYKEFQIFPNELQVARYVNVYIKISTQGAWFCEAQVFADAAPSIHQCFDPNDMDDSLRTRDIVKGTVTFGSSCYTFDNEINHWSRAKDQCKATNGGTLAFNITSEINALLIGFAKANNIVSMNWIGARTDRLVVPGLKGDYAYDWQWINGEKVDKLWFNPEIIKENECLGINFPSGVWHNYACYSVTGSVCQAAIKQCSSPERHLGVQIENAGSFSIGSVLNYSCAFGYVLKGNNTRECLSTGMWSGEPPQCFHNETLHQKAELTLDTTALIGVIVAGIVIAILLIVIVISIVILKRKRSFKKTIHFKKDKNSESVEPLDYNAQKSDHEAINQSQTRNYETIPQESQEAHK